MNTTSSPILNAEISCLVLPKILGKNGWFSGYNSPQERLKRKQIKQANCPVEQNSTLLSRLSEEILDVVQENSCWYIVK